MPNTLQPPQSLLKLQEWFVGVVRTPNGRLDVADVNRVNQVISPSNTLTPIERVAIYIDDYWARCIDSLKDDFHGTIQLLGETKGHDYITRYIQIHSSQSFTLFHLGTNFVPFMAASYEGNDKEFVMDVARFEWAWLQSFCAKAVAPFSPLQLTAGQQEKLASIPFRLQDHVYLLDVQYPVLGWYHRKRGTPSRFPMSVVLYQDSDGWVVVRRIARTFSRLLQSFQKEGSSLENAIENQQQMSATRLSNWFQLAVSHGWFCHL